MHALYVDSTSGLVVGLLNSKYEWIEYKDTDEKKPSEVIHLEIYNLIKKYNLNTRDINFIFSSGPGSYTGMRLGEGIAQILALDEMNVYSFHHFNVPLYMGIEKGFWVMNAFKQQIFLFSWDTISNTFEKTLVNNDDFKIIDSQLGYSLENSTSEFSNLKSTKNLLKDNPMKIFSHVVQNQLREPPFYFRTLEEEFK